MTEIIVILFLIIVACVLVIVFLAKDNKNQGKIIEDYYKSNQELLVTIGELRLTLANIKEQATKTLENKK